MVLTLQWGPVSVPSTSTPDCTCSIPVTGAALLLLTLLIEETGTHHIWILVPFLTVLGSVGGWVVPPWDLVLRIFYTVPHSLLSS